MKALLLPLSLLAIAGPAAAATINETPADISFSQTYADTSGLAASPVIVPDTYFTAQVSPFDTTLGTLNGVTLTWTLTGNFTATTGPNGGGFSIAYIGSFIVNDFSIADPSNSSGFAEGGGGGGGGGAPFTAISGNFSTPTPFVVTVQSDDTPYAFFSGTTPVTVGWAIPVVYSGAPDIANLAVDINASVVVSYDYTPVPEPASAGLLAVAGLFAMGRRRKH